MHHKHSFTKWQLPFGMPIRNWLIDCGVATVVIAGNLLLWRSWIATSHASCSESHSQRATICSRAVLRRAVMLAWHLNMVAVSKTETPQSQVLGESWRRIVCIFLSRGDCFLVAELAPYCTLGRGRLDIARKILGDGSRVDLKNHCVIRFVWFEIAEVSKIFLFAFVRLSNPCCWCHWLQCRGHSLGQGTQISEGPVWRTR